MIEDINEVINDMHFRQRALEKLLGVEFDDKTTSYVEFDWSSVKGQDIKAKTKKGRTYDAKWYCSNCRESNLVKTAFGSKPKDMEYECPSCGVTSKPFKEEK